MQKDEMYSIQGVLNKDSKVNKLCLGALSNNVLDM